MKKSFRQSVLIAFDALSIFFAYNMAFLLRFDSEFFTSHIVEDYLNLLYGSIFTIIFIKILVLYVFGMYNSLWKHAGVNELIQVVKAVTFATAMSLSYIIIKEMAFPRSIYIMTWFIEVLFLGGVRFSYRIVRLWKNKQFKRFTKCVNVMVVGAGQAGAMIIKEMHDHPELNYHPIAVIDDDRMKQQRKLSGVNVIGGREDIEWAALKYNIEEIIIAMPSRNRNEIKEIIDLASRTEAKLKIVPGVYELIDGKVSINQVREVEIKDILGREEVELDIDSIAALIKDKNVLVTGAGGSIGSELCRQIVEFNPKNLYMLDIYENNVYSLELDLKKNYPELEYEVFISSVRDRERVFEIFEIYKPDLVFHAAAHKHVPLMEANPMEAVKNNVFGTKNVVDASVEYGCDRFTLISTDKAVNPTNIMGATKRICELIVQSKRSNGKTKLSAVRFGNVLGSNGSVIPIFKKQIEAGGPVTLTHDDIIRYFMTIPEAAKLVIQSTVLALEGEIFILDMGNPVRIRDLAENMIRLSGFEPGVDIDIEVTGLRPGEKLYEELILDKEKAVSTRIEKIFIEKPIVVETDWIAHNLDMLRFNLGIDNIENLKSVIHELVPTYAPPEHDRKKGNRS